jgi:FMN phosphatase YigB (HAD superfamily)
MIDTILFDLDGTLLPLSQDDFIAPYFKGLSNVFVRLGLDPDTATKAVWAGTKAMVLNDGAMLNSQRFWNTFAKTMELDIKRLAEIETATDDFYVGAFEAIVEGIIKPTQTPSRMIRSLRKREAFDVVLATNPLFPICAVESRLRCLGLTTGDFNLVTHYGNSTYCKPNLGYYREIFDKLDKSPQQCLMVGNNTVEDLCVSELGTETFLVTDFIENSDNTDYEPTYKGTLVELESFILQI